MVILDIEIWQYDLLVAIKDYGTNNYQYYWGKSAKEVLEKLHKDRTPVIAFNSMHYDSPILYNYFFNEHNRATPIELSKLIIEDNYKLKYPEGFFNDVDLFFHMSATTRVGLKVIEAIMGWEIRETTIDFTYEFKLTEEQRREAEHYVNQDLDAAEALYNKMKYYLDLRIKLSEYLGIEHNWATPLPTLMGMGLGAHRRSNLNKPPIHPLVKNIPIKHEIGKIMLRQLEELHPAFSAQFEMNGSKYTVANGGIHDDNGPWSGYDVWHVDVKGYYTLLQDNFDLWSRNIPKEGQSKVSKMRKDRLTLKETDPVTADSFKIGILSTWGATKNRAHILYDYYIGCYIPLYGQIFQLYLIELFSEAGIKIINANTDGLIVKGDADVIKKVVDSWIEYGGFEVELINYKRFIQKDVNNYIIGNSLDKLHVKGRDFTAIKRDWLFSNIVSVPQTKVISKVLAELLWYNEQEGFDPDAWARKRVTEFDVSDYMFIIRHTYKYDGLRYVETGEKIQKVNRVYAHKEGYSIEKYKGDSTYAYPGLPPVKTCNSNLKEVNKEDLNIDYDFYVDEIMRKYVAYYG